VDVSKRNQKWLRDHRRKLASPGVPRKTEEDQSRPARYGNFSKAPKPSPKNTSKCSLTAAQAPAIRGIKLGMSAEEIVSIFPGSSQRPEIKMALESSEGYPNYGVARLYFQLPTYPTVAKGRFAGIDGISVTLFDGRVAELQVNRLHALTQRIGATRTTKRTGRTHVRMIL
jgi:hypothetical protein